MPTIEQEQRQADSFFLSAVFRLSDEWAVKIISIDVERRILDFDCADDKRHPFAVKLTELFENYLV